MEKGLVGWGSFFRYICRSSFNAPQWENNRVRLMFRDGCGRVLQHCRKENKSWWKQWDRRSRGEEIRRTPFIFFIYNCHSMACFPFNLHNNYHSIQPKLTTLNKSNPSISVSSHTTMSLSAFLSNSNHDLPTTNFLTAVLHQHTPAQPSPISTGLPQA